MSQLAWSSSSRATHPQRATYSTNRRAARDVALPFWKDVGLVAHTLGCDHQRHPFLRPEDLVAQALEVLGKMNSPAAVTHLMRVYHSAESVASNGILQKIETCR